MVVGQHVGVARDRTAPCSNVDNAVLDVDDLRYGPGCTRADHDESWCRIGHPHIIAAQRARLAQDHAPAPLAHRRIGTDGKHRHEPHKSGSRPLPIKTKG